MKKYLLLLFLLLCVTVPSFNTVFAAETTVFNDIADCEYKASILELYEEGIIVGTEEGNFEPDREVTEYEFCVMLARAFYPDEDYSVVPDGQEWFVPYVNKLQNEGIVNGNLYWNWSKGYYSAASFIEKTLNAAGYYDRPLDDYNWFDRIEKTAFDNGLICKDYDCSNKILRGEIADIINKVHNDSFPRIMYASEFPLKYSLDYFKGMDDLFRENLSSLQSVPEKYINLFNEKGYTYIMSDKCENYYPPENYDVDEDINGVTDWRKKVVCVEYGSTAADIRHEFGHVVSYELLKGNRPRVINFMYKYEKDSVKGILPKYALTDPDEFFAEAFDYLLINRDNDEEIAKFREAAPITTKIILDNMISCDGLVNLKEINRIVRNV